MSEYGFLGELTHEDFAKNNVQLRNWYVTARSSLVLPFFGLLDVA